MSNFSTRTFYECIATLILVCVVVMFFAYIFSLSDTKSLNSIEKCNVTLLQAVPDANDTEARSSLLENCNK